VVAPRAADAFYFDLASPLAYLAAERILPELGRLGRAGVEWRPVLARELSGGEGFDAFRCQAEEEAFREDVASRARELELQPLRWPEPFPFDSTLAMRAATYAKSIGRAVPFVQAAFRQAFAGGHSLEDPDVVLIAAAACEMHPAAVLRGCELRSVHRQLAAATNDAETAQINEIPAIVLDGQVFAGERAVAQAAAHARAVADSERAPAS
jgi:2-hydroxychromene-2-carboxylate isomerase